MTIGTPVTKDNLQANWGLAASEFLTALARFHAIDLWMSAHPDEVAAFAIAADGQTTPEAIRAEMASRYAELTDVQAGKTFHMRKVVGLAPLV